MLLNKLTVNQIRATSKLETAAVSRRSLSVRSGVRAGGLVAEYNG